MSVTIADDRIILSGTASVEEAEPLLAALTDNPAFPIDVGGLAKAHFSVVQLLHAAQRPLVGVPHSPFLRQFALVELIEIKAT